MFLLFFYKNIFLMNLFYDEKEFVKAVMLLCFIKNLLGDFCSVLDNQFVVKPKKHFGRHLSYIIGRWKIDDGWQFHFIHCHNLRILIFGAREFFTLFWKIDKQNIKLQTILQLVPRPPCCLLQNERILNRYGIAPVYNDR